MQGKGINSIIIGTDADGNKIVGGQI